jgi:hypothetical protein
VSFADSPITSTTFYEVYLYNSMIDEAKHCGYMSKENAKYLNNDSNPVEMKAALINALGWDESGKNNANLYSKYIYGKNWDELDLEQMSAPQLMVLGYLVVMDDYFKPEVALPILEKALQKDKYSYTINVIHSLIKAQLVMNEDFCEVWKVYYNVNSNKNLLPDLTPQAKEIIYNYMLVYKSYCQ